MLPYSLQISVIFHLMILTGSLAPHEAPLDEINRRQHSQTALATTPCPELRQIGTSLTVDGRYNEAEDTLRYYIENCYSDPDSWRAFNPHSTSVQFKSEDNDRWLAHREWLKTVMFLNTQEPRYYCSALISLLNSFSYIDPKTNSQDWNGSVAVIDHLLGTTQCQKFETLIRSDRAYTRDLQYRVWADTVRDSLATPLDTTKPSLEELGMEWIRKPSAVAALPQDITRRFGAVTVSQNPFEVSSELCVELLEDGYVKLEILDMLGNQHYESSGYTHRTKGRSTITLPETLPAGWLIARLSTPSGEVRSVKLQKLK